MAAEKPSPAPSEILSTRSRQTLVLVLSLLLLLAAAGMSCQALRQMRLQHVKSLAVTLTMVLDANDRTLRAVLHARQDELRNLASQQLTRQHHAGLALTDREQVNLFSLG